ncbi:MAG: helix-turn-helix transcriptional regulator, partial [Eubacteriales bacterium]
MGKTTIGSFIAVLRKETGMTQQELADRLNVSNKSVSRWECDKSTPDIMLIPAIAEMFGITADELLRGERNGEAKSNNELTAVTTGAPIKQLINRSLSRFKLISFAAAVISVFAFMAMFIIAFIFEQSLIGFIFFGICESISVTLMFLMLNICKSAVENSGFIEPDDADFIQYKQHLYL